MLTLVSVLWCSMMCDNEVSQCHSVSPAQWTAAALISWHETWQMGPAHHDQLLQLIMRARRAGQSASAQVTCHVSIVTTDSSLACLHNSISDPCLLFTDLWPLPGLWSLRNLSLNLFCWIWMEFRKHIVQQPPAPLTVPIDVWKKKNLGCIHNWRDLKVNLLLLLTVEWLVRFIEGWLAPGLSSHWISFIYLALARLAPRHQPWTPLIAHYKELIWSPTSWSWLKNTNWSSGPIIVNLETCVNLNWIWFSLLMTQVTQQ